MLSGSLFALLALAAPPAWAISPEQAASYCYDQAKKMGFSSRDMEDRSWEDCMSQFRRQAQPTQPAAPGLSPQERMLLLQQLMLMGNQNRAPASNPGLEFGAGVQRGCATLRAATTRPTVSV